MPNLSRRRVYFTLLGALLLQLLPFSGWLLQIKPDFLLLALLFWLLRAPNICNIGIAWTAGILMDLISGDLFGQNALAYALTAFLAVMYQRRLILFTVLQQSAYVFLLLFVNQVISRFTVFRLPNICSNTCSRPKYLFRNDIFRFIN